MKYFTREDIDRVARKAKRCTYCGEPTYIHYAQKLPPVCGKCYEKLKVMWLAKNSQ